MQLHVHGKTRNVKSFKLNNLNTGRQKRKSMSNLWISLCGFLQLSYGMLAITASYISQPFGFLLAE